MYEEAEAEIEKLDGNMKSYSRVYLKFELQTADGINEQSTDSTIFDDGDTIDRLKAENITMSYGWAERNHLVRLTLPHGSVSNLIISGDNPDWVSATSAKFDELIKSIQPQNMLYQKHKFLFNLFINLSFGYFVMSALILLLNLANSMNWIKKTEQPTVTEGFWDQVYNTPVLGWMLIGINFYGLGFLVSGWFKNSISELFPLTELQIGPSHRQEAKKHRNIISFTLVVFLMPIVTNFLYDFLKIYIK